MNNKDLDSLKLALPQYLEALGCKITRGRCRCPVHNGDSKTTAFLDTRAGLVCGMPAYLHCPKCDKTWDIIGLYAVLNGLDEKRDFVRICAEVGAVVGVSVTTAAPPPSYARRDDCQDKQEYADKQAKAAAYVKDCAKHLDGAASYLAQRGISLETARRFGLGYDAHTRRLVIPTGDGYNARATWDCAKNERYRKAAGLEYRCFGIDALRPGEFAWIVEGEIDALSILDVNHAAVGLGGKGNVTSLCNYLAQMPDFKTQPPRLILALDNDTEGQAAQDALKSWLEGQGAPFCIAPAWTGKDANDALQSDREGFIKTLEATEADFKDAKQRAIDAYNDTSLYYSMPGIWTAAQHADSAIQTGFKELDDILGGGLRPGLHVFGAIPSLGKTALVLQIACDIASKGIDVLYFSLEMPKEDLVWRSVSRLTYTQDKTTNHTNALSQRDLQFTDWETLGPRGAVALGAYDAFMNTTARNMWIFDSIGALDVEQIGQAIAKHKDLRGQAPVVVVDYLQILRPIDPHMTDKAALDYNALRLKQIAMQYKSPMMIISSFNRANYATEAGFESFKESGAIEYCADCLFALQFKAAIDAKQATKGAENQTQAIKDAIRAAKASETRDIELVVLKNRMGRTTGDRGLFMRFVPRFNLFTDFMF